MSDTPPSVSPPPSAPRFEHLTNGLRWVALSNDGTVFSRRLQQLWVMQEGGKRCDGPPTDGALWAETPDGAGWVYLREEWRDVPTVAVGTINREGGA